MERLRRVARCLDRGYPDADRCGVVHLTREPDSVSPGDVLGEVSPRAVAFQSVLWNEVWGLVAESRDSASPALGVRYDDTLALFRQLGLDIPVRFLAADDLALGRIGTTLRWMDAVLGGMGEDGGSFVDCVRRMVDGGSVARDGLREIREAGRYGVSWVGHDGYLAVFAGFRFCEGGSTTVGVQVDTAPGTLVDAALRALVASDDGWENWVDPESGTPVGAARVTVLESLYRAEVEPVRAVLRGHLEVLAEVLGGPSSSEAAPPLATAGDQ